MGSETGLKNLDEEEEEVKSYPKLEVRLRETRTLNLFYQENISLHYNDPESKHLIESWAAYSKVTTTSLP